jgi:hypothetical protein
MSRFGKIVDGFKKGADLLGKEVKKVSKKATEINKKIKINGKDYVIQKQLGTGRTIFLIALQLKIDRICPTKKLTILLRRFCICIFGRRLQWTCLCGEKNYHSNCRCTKRRGEGDRDYGMANN